MLSSDPPQPWLTSSPVLALPCLASSVPSGLHPDEPAPRLRADAHRASGRHEDTASLDFQGPATEFPVQTAPKNGSVMRTQRAEPLESSGSS